VPKTLDDIDIAVGHYNSDASFDFCMQDDSNFNMRQINSSGSHKKLAHAACGFMPLLLLCWYVMNAAAIPIFAHPSILIAASKYMTKGDKV
jgi:hypothetical protein